MSIVQDKKITLQGKDFGTLLKEPLHNLRTPRHCSGQAGSTENIPKSPAVTLVAGQNAAISALKRGNNKIRTIYKWLRRNPCLVENN